MKNKINKISSQSGVKKLNLIIKKINKKTGDNNSGRIIELDSRVSGLESKVAL